MSNPEDDPQTVVPIANDLFASGSFEDYAAALIEARARLKAARSVIDRDKDPKKAELEDLCAKGRLRYEVHTTGNEVVGKGVFMDVDCLFPEQTFIDELVKGVSKDRRSDQRRKFATDWWARWRRIRPDAPDIADPQTWTLSTLKKWKESFDNFHHVQSTLDKRRNFGEANPLDEHGIPLVDRIAYMRVQHMP